ncbi:putative ribonuclease H-like domain-containing protein [Tanacetum coccineum]
MPLDAGKKDDKGVNKENRIDDQEKLENSSQDVNTAGPSINTASTNVNTGSLNINTVNPTVTSAPLEATHADFFSDETEVDMSNITTTYLVPSTLYTRIHKDHSLDHVIGDVQSGVQTRRMIKTTNEQGFISVVYEEKTHENLYTCMLTCFLSQEEPERIAKALSKRAIGTKWVFRNKKDERGIVIRNKARLVAQGHTQEEGINYDEVFTLVARIEAIRLFLAYASFMGFMVYQMDMKSAFLYGRIEEKVYVCQPLGYEYQEKDKIKDKSGQNQARDWKEHEIPSPTVPSSFIGSARHHLYGSDRPTLIKSPSDVIKVSPRLNEKEIKKKEFLASWIKDLIPTQSPIGRPRMKGKDAAHFEMDTRPSWYYYA